MQTTKDNLKRLFAEGEHIYSGYVDDPRNTDNAWMETIVMLFLDGVGDSVSKFDLKAGSDACQVYY